MSDWFEGSGSGGLVDVPALFDSVASERLFAVVALGALVSVGLTRDGGALGITVTSDGRWRREYFRDPEAAAAWLDGAAAALGGNGHTTPVSPPSGPSRGRRRY
jgi:hypothetical protein